MTEWRTVGLSSRQSFALSRSVLFRELDLPWCAPYPKHGNAATTLRLCYIISHSPAKASHQHLRSVRVSQDADEASVLCRTIMIPPRRPAAQDSQLVLRSRPLASHLNPTLPRDIWSFCGLAWRVLSRIAAHPALASLLVAVVTFTTLSAPGLAVGSNVTSSERQALTDFYLAMNGSKWANNTGWSVLPTGGDPCIPSAAFGVTCTNTTPNHIG